MNTARQKALDTVIAQLQSLEVLNFAIDHKEYLRPLCEALALRPHWILPLILYYILKEELAKSEDWDLLFEQFETMCNAAREDMRCE